MALAEGEWMVTEADLQRWRLRQVVVIDRRVFVCPCTGYVYSRNHIRRHVCSKAHREWIEGMLEAA